MGIFYWINAVKGFTPLDFLLLGIYLGSYFGFFGLLFNLILKRTKLVPLVVAPALWVSFEYLRSHAGFLGLPWALLGHSQYLNLPLIQIASLTGVYGVSFLIVMFNAALSEVISYRLSKRKKDLVSKNYSLFRPVFIPLFLVGLSVIYGFSVISEKTDVNRLSVTVIQGNISQNIKWNRAFKKMILDKHVKLTESASINNHASLIVWPESSVPGPFTQDLYALQTISNLAKKTGTYLLIGSSQRPKFGSGGLTEGYSFNSAFLITPNGIIARYYDKIHLLPFAEYLPYKDSCPLPARFISRAGSFLSGKEYTLFNIEGIHFGTLICWENIFPELFRKFVRKGASCMINITNEAWFGETAAPYHFIAMSVFRAVENHVGVIRSANTGISCFIDPHGEIIGRVKNDNKDIFIEGYLTMAIPLSFKKTIYTLYGDIFVYIILVMTILMIVLSAFKTEDSRI
jgi:apolipoprotein N-acyltransferase